LFFLSFFLSSSSLLYLIFSKKGKAVYGICFVLSIYRVKIPAWIPIVLIQIFLGFPQVLRYIMIREEDLSILSLCSLCVCFPAVTTHCGCIVTAH
jgi:hypothetical protein